MSLLGQVCLRYMNARDKIAAVAHKVINPRTVCEGSVQSSRFSGRITDGDFRGYLKLID